MRSFAVTVSMLAASLAAQTVWLVPDTTSVDAVIAQAAPGDVIRLSNSHPPFTISKGVEVVGAPGGTSIYYYQPPNLPGPGHIAVAVPVGQRAVLRGVWVISSTFQGETEGVLELVSGQCEVSDCSVAGPIRVRGGNHVLQRISPQLGTWLDLQGGICSVADSSFLPVLRPGYSSVYGRPGIGMFGGLLLASRVTVRGTDSSGLGAFAESGLLMFGGTAYLTDCSVRGGDAVFGPQPPAPAMLSLFGLNLASLARTSMTQSPSAPASNGFTVMPGMVGMSCQGVPTVGASFTVVATAGNSQQALGILGGFDATPGSVAPFVEPLFGTPGTLVPVLVAFPAPAATVSATVSVPNLPALRGLAVWLQAAQVDGTSIRASALVGGTIR